MSLGSRIHAQRSAHNLSQVDLADLLEVSRQSISKWETDASVPELDKLIKMCEVFGVSLDQLVLGREPAAPQAPAVQTLTVSQSTVGFALFALGLVALIIVAAVQNIMSGIFLALPFLACGGLCFLVRKKRNLYLSCGWMLWISLFFGIYFSIESDSDPFTTFFYLAVSPLAWGEFHPIAILAFLGLAGLVVLLTFTLAYDQIFPPDNKP